MPATRLRAYAQGNRVVRAGDVVPGSPAADIWDAHRALYAYMSRWAARDGDSPADLTAAVDGLVEVADTLAEVTAMVLAQIERRTERGSLTGADAARVQQARADLASVLLRDEDGRHNKLRGGMDTLRDALDGARPVLPAGDGRTLPPLLARQMTGKTVAELRAALGQETHWQRHRSKTRAPQYDKADALHRMIQWCQATGRDTYDPAAHAQDCL
ncbi:hypothetical protein ACTOB_003814 [Actinoplanes oblitus]|uniref:Uncharacterized protein n=1 Tax=Actinoplanes oblitus TaxID=3040509 RepID=A0ABY8WSP7_9ACTN|nr:hypothetical protein [Actinoplanes oblitus]WIN00129.1 hypothetical protein ACTOB_003814 [Actinoplanes oblitus]